MGALEGEMFDEMGHSRLRRLLVARADTHHVATINDGRIRLLVDDAQPIGEGVCMTVGGNHRRRFLIIWRKPS